MKWCTGKLYAIIVRQKDNLTFQGIGKSSMLFSFVHSNALKIWIKGVGIVKMNSKRLEAVVESMIVSGRRSQFIRWGLIKH